MEKNDQPISKLEKRPQAAKPDKVAFKKPALPQRFQQVSPKQTGETSGTAKPLSQGESSGNPPKAVLNFGNLAAQLAEYNKTFLPLPQNQTDEKKRAVQHSGGGSKPVEEDVFSDGEPDEELDAEVARLTARWEKTRLTEAEASSVFAQLPLTPEPVPPRLSPVTLAKLLKEDFQREKRQKQQERLNAGRPPAKKVKVPKTKKEEEEEELNRKVQFLENITTKSFFFIVPKDLRKLKNHILYPILCRPENLRGELINGAKCIMVKDKDSTLKILGCKLLNRLIERDPLVEAPLPLEFLQKYDHITKKHPKADLYDPKWDYAMVAYAQDPFWSQLRIPTPPGMVRPDAPGSHWSYLMKFNRPTDNSDPCPIHIPEGAWALFEKTKRELSLLTDEERDARGFHADL